MFYHQIGHFFVVFVVVGNGSVVTVVVVIVVVVIVVVDARVVVVFGFGCINPISKLEKKTLHLKRSLTFTLQKPKRSQHFQFGENSHVFELRF